MATKVGLLHLDVLINDAMSLKDKRRVIKSFKDRIGAHWNAAVAEVDHLDSMRHGLLAVAVVGNDGRYLEGSLQQIVNAARANHGWLLVNSEIEII
jgi:uncharacterized protein